MEEKIRIYTWKEFDEDCVLIAKYVKRDLRVAKQIYAIPRGGYALALKLSHLLELPILTYYTEIDENTLVVDDVSDSGKTLEKLTNKLPEKVWTGMLIATLFYNRKSIVKPNVWLHEKRPNTWILFPWENPDKVINDKKEYNMRLKK